MMPAEGFNDKSTNCRPWNINQIPIGAGADCTSVVELCDGDMLFLNLSSARQVVPEFSYTGDLIASDAGKCLISTHRTTKHAKNKKRAESS
jgi:hypothetical protein